MSDPIDDLEALFALPAAGEPAAEPERKPNLIVQMQIEGTTYARAYLMPIGFPYRYQNERAVVDGLAVTLGEVVAKTFIDHWYARTEEDG